MIFISHSLKLETPNKVFAKKSMDTARPFFFSFLKKKIRRGVVKFKLGVSGPKLK